MNEPMRLRARVATPIKDVRHALTGAESLCSRSTSVAHVIGAIEVVVESRLMLDVGPDRLSCRRPMWTVSGVRLALVELSGVEQRCRAVLAVERGAHDELALWDHSGS
jgi:hypothetical protein